MSVLEFNAIKKNLRIMSDIERVFGTVLNRMASRVLVFFTPSDSSLVRHWFVCREPRTPVVELVWEAYLNAKFIKYSFQRLCTNTNNSTLRYSKSYFNFCNIPPNLCSGYYPTLDMISRGSDRKDL